MKRSTASTHRPRAIMRGLLPLLALGLFSHAASAQFDGKPEEKNEKSKREIDFRKASEDVTAREAKTSSLNHPEPLNRPESLNRPDQLNKPEVKAKIDRELDTLKKADVQLKDASKVDKPTAGSDKPTGGSTQGKSRAPGKK